MQKETQLHVAGIDIGNQNTICAIQRNSGADICLNQTGTRISPSIVTFAEDRRYSGDLAYNQIMENISTTITDIKKLIMLPYNSEKRVNLEKRVPFEMAELPDGYTGVCIKVGEEKILFRIEQILAFIIKTCVENIRKYDENLQKVYISVDSCWNNEQRMCLLNAARIAGIECDLVNSSVAAALAFVSSHREKLPATENQAGPVCIVDIGDSSMKTCVAVVSCESVDVIAYDEDDTICGSNITTKFADYLSDKIKTQFKIDVNEKPIRRLQFLNKVEKAKKNLSLNQVVQFDLQVGEREIMFTIKREELEGLMTYEIEHVNDKIQTVIEQGKERIGKVRLLELIGGTGRIPCLKAKVNELGLEVLSSVNTEECIATGCALFDAMKVTQRIPYQIKGKTETGEAVLFNEGAVLPTDEAILFFKGEAELSCGIKMNVGGESPHIKLTRSGTVVIMNDENTTVAIPGYLDEEQIAEFGRIEDYLIDRDRKAIEIDNEKNELESALFKTEKMLNGEEATKFLAGEELEEFRNTINEVRMWYDEHEFDRMTLEEYTERKNQLKQVMDVPLRRLRVHKMVQETFPELVKRTCDVAQKASEDEPRVDNGEKNKLIKDASDASNQLAEALNSPICQDIEFNFDELSEAVSELEKRLARLKAMPRVRKQKKKQQEDFSFWDL